MKILSLRPEIKRYLKERNLEKKFRKQKKLFEGNPFHPSLKTELLEPRKMRIRSFRLELTANIGQFLFLGKKILLKLSMRMITINRLLKAKL